MLKKIEVIIFDNDGTLVETDIPDYLACKSLCEDLGLRLTPEIWIEHTLGELDVHSSLFNYLTQYHNNGSLTSENLWEHWHQLWSVNMKNVTLKPGAIELLSRLHISNYKLAVATSADRNWVNYWLKLFNLFSYFEIVVTKNDVIKNKPFPDVYLFVANYFGVYPCNCLVFEDSITGVKAAKSAGMKVIAVPTTITQISNFKQADFLIDSLEVVTVEWLDEIIKFF